MEVGIRTCCASSLVGLMTTALNPFERWNLSSMSKGIKYAKVFPDPVGAQAKTSRLANMSGIACICIGVGVLKLNLSMLAAR